MHVSLRLVYRYVWYTRYSKLYVDYARETTTGILNCGLSLSRDISIGFLGTGLEKLIWTANSTRLEDIHFFPLNIIEILCQIVDYSNFCTVHSLNLSDLQIISCGLWRLHMLRCRVTPHLLFAIFCYCCVPTWIVRDAYGPRYATFSPSPSMQTDYKTHSKYGGLYSVRYEQCIIRCQHNMTRENVMLSATRQTSFAYTHLYTYIFPVWKISCYMSVFCWFVVCLDSWFLSLGSVHSDIFVETWILLFSSLPKSCSYLPSIKLSSLAVSWE